MFGLTLGPLETNCYLLMDDDSRDAVIVDPADEAERIRDAVSELGASVGAIWLTHAHFDHIGALAELLERGPSGFDPQGGVGSASPQGAPVPGALPVYLHPDDRPLYEHAAEQAAAFGMRVRAPRAETTPLSHGQRVRVGEHEAVCLHTPGHAPGHIAFSFAREGLVLCGDALFAGSIGRTDLPLGDHATLLRSIREQLLTLPDETIAYPGHGPRTTIGAERRSNPFLI